MRPLDKDVLEFVRERFQPEAVDKALDVLRAEVLSTVRVQRAVLFLSDGSLSMLKHYADCAARDVREILKRAEYVLGVTEAPMPVRDFMQPLQGRPGSMGTGTLGLVSTPSGPARAKRSRPPGGLRIQREQLTGAQFALGKARYKVAEGQEYGPLVRCVRRCDTLVSIVQLPLLFVLDQLSEHIDLVDAGD